ANQRPSPVGTTPAGPRVRPGGPRVPAERAVVLAHHGLELAAMSATCIALGSVHASPMPGQPSAGFGVQVLAVAQIQKLALQRDLGLGVRPGPADLALE